MKVYENIDKRLHKELEKLDKKFEGESGDMSGSDLELIDCLFHALKSAETYYAMSDYGSSGGYSGGYSGNSYNSYARGRDSRGRYVSRDMMSEGGYSGGYSGHYPPMYSRYPSYEDGRY